MELRPVTYRVFKTAGAQRATSVPGRTRGWHEHPQRQWRRDRGRADRRPWETWIL